MSETETSTIDASVVPPAIETTAEAPTESQATETTESTPAPASNKPAGYAPVDVNTSTPEQIKERIDYLYSQVKPTQRENREMRGLLEQQSRIINELSQTTQGVVNHLTERSFSDNETALKTQMQEAWKKGDNVAYIDAQTKLNELFAEKAVAKQQRPQPQQQQQTQQTLSAAEIANRAMQSGDISGEEYRATESWQNERDDSGNLLRPWAFANDPSYQAALFESRSVLANPRFANLTYEQKLQEIDKRMGVQKRTATQSVIGGSLTKPSKTVKIQLSPKQREIALKTQYAGKGKSEAEHLEKFRQQIEKFQTRRA